MVFSVEVARAEQREINRSLEFSASVEPWRLINLSSQVQGLVLDASIEEGQPLAEGEPVARLDDEAAGLMVAAAQARLDQAKADLARLRSGFRTEEIDEARKDLAAARARLDSARDDEGLVASVDEPHPHGLRRIIGANILRR